MASERKPVQGVGVELPEPARFDHNPVMIEEELHRVLQSKLFSRSSRLRRLLEYIIIHWLAGEVDLLDGYNLALAVFGRGPSFESALDPIVRVHVSRLRKLLTRYYLEEGIRDILRIDIPRGTYIPVARAPSHHPPNALTATDFENILVMVVPFEVRGGTMQETPYAFAFADELMYLLTQAPGICVTSRISAAHLDPSLDARLVGQRFGAQFIVEGVVTTLVDKCDLIVHLSDTARGHNLWSDHFAATAESLMATSSEIARALIHEIKKAR